VLPLCIIAEDQIARPVQRMRRFVVMRCRGPADKRDLLETLLFALDVVFSDGILDVLQQFVVFVVAASASET